VVLDVHMLHLQLAASVLGVAHAHGLRVEDVNIDEVAGHQLLKPDPVPSPLHFAWFHQSPYLFSLGDFYCNTTDITYDSYRT